MFSLIDEDGNLGYYVYDVCTGEEKLFADILADEDERLFAAAEPAGRKFAGKFKDFHRDMPTNQGAEAKKMYEAGKQKLGAALGNLKNDVVTTYKKKYAGRVKDAGAKFDKYMNGYFDNIDNQARSAKSIANIVTNGAGDVKRIIGNLKKDLKK